MAEKNESLILVKDLYAAFARGNAELALSLLHEAIVWEIVGSQKQVPYFGRYCGRAEVRRFFSILLGAQDFEYFAADEFVVDGHRVVALGSERARTRSTGKHFETRWAHFFECADQSIIGFREYIDAAPIISALTAEEAG